MSEQPTVSTCQAPEPFDASAAIDALVKALAEKEQVKYYLTVISPADLMPVIEHLNDNGIEVNLLFDSPGGIEWDRLPSWNYYQIGGRSGNCFLAVNNWATPGVILWREIEFFYAPKIIEPPVRYAINIEFGIEWYSMFTNPTTPDVE